jgi:hypothetical protein
MPNAPCFGSCNGRCPAPNPSHTNSTVTPLTHHSPLPLDLCPPSYLPLPLPPPLAPKKQAEAPYSSVYRPAQPLSGLASGDSTAAGAGGSQGVWTLTVTDTAATK